MSYIESVRFLYSLGNELKPGVKFSLDAMQTLLGALDNPEHNGRFIHVAGTNGKGSTAAAIAAVLQAAGLRTGLYTSPHLHEPTERIQVNGIPISDAQFTSAFAVVHDAAERLLSKNLLLTHPSYFETVTAMALLHFQDRCDISVIEVGLGGRLDATNVIDPQLAVITPVSFDHESYLGNTLELIAVEKAGIVKQGKPVVVALQSPVALDVIKAQAEQKGAKLIDCADAVLEHVVAGLRHSTFTLDGVPFELNLAGRHQVDNAVTAITACRALNIESSCIQAGIRDVRWPGRLEYVDEAPNLILDGAHNPAGAAALADYILTFCSGQPVWIVYGAMRDKAIDEVTSLLFPLAQRLILTAPNLPRALRPEAIREMTDHPHAQLTSDVAEAVAVAQTAPRNAYVFFTGSLFVVGEARELLQPQRLPGETRHA